MATSILEQIAAGEQAAVRQCMDEYSALVWSLARRYCQSVADAEDATQEIFLEIWKSAGRYQASLGSEATFITTIARRRLIDRLRAHKRRPESEEFDETRFADEHSASPVPAALTSEVDAARAALAALPEAQREVLLLGIVEGLTHSEIATRTGRPLGTVKTQMRRGMLRIREMLDVSESETESAND